MQNMESFYMQLTAYSAQDDPIIRYLSQLTKLEPKQIASLNSLLWWNTWGASDSPTIAVANFKQ